MHKKTIITVIPAYNEGITIGSVVLGCSKYMRETVPKLFRLAMKKTAKIPRQTLQE